MWRTRRASDQVGDRRIFPGQRLASASALHNFLAFIFAAPSVTTWSDTSGNTRKNQVTRLVTLRHRSTMSGALILQTPGATQLGKDLRIRTGEQVVGLV